MRTFFGDHWNTMFQQYENKSYTKEHTDRKEILSDQNTIKHFFRAEKTLGELNIFWLSKNNQKSMKRSKYDFFTQKDDLKNKGTSEKNVGLWKRTKKNA